MKRENLEWLACMVVASVALVYSLWVVPYIPTSDGPQHIFSVHIENHYSDVGSPYPEYYRTLPQFAGKGFSLVYAPLEGLMPWRVALKVTLSLVSLAFAWGFALVVLALDRERRPASLLGFAVALPWSLYMGFFPFVVGSTVGLYTLAFVLYRPPTTLRRRAVIALLLLLQGVCHIFTAIVSGVVVAVLAIACAPKGQRVREAGRMALVGAPAALLLTLTLRERNLASTAQKTVDWSLGTRLGEISRWYAPGPGARGWLVIALVIAGATMALIRARRGQVSTLERAFAGLAVAFVAGTMLAPVHVPGWQCLAQRFAVLASVLGLALLRLPERASARTARAAVVLVTIGCVGSSLVSARLHRQLAEGCADALSGLDAPLQFKGPRLPIVLEPACGASEDPSSSSVPGASLAANTPLLYLVDHGGIAPKMFNGAPSIHAIAFHGSRMPAPPSPFAQGLAMSRQVESDKKLRTSVMIELAADGMAFEGIHLLGGRPSDFSVFNARGYVTELESGSLFIARFEGCPAEVLLPAGALDREPVYCEYGLFSHNLITPGPRTLARFRIPPETPVVAGAIHVPLPGRPCGPLWIRVVWDADASSTLTEGDRTCDQATFEGRMVATVSRDRPTVLCAHGSAPPPP